MSKLIKTDRRYRLSVDKMNDLALFNLHLKLANEDGSGNCRKRKSTAAKDVKTSLETSSVQRKIIKPTVADLITETSDWESTRETLLRN